MSDTAVFTVRVPEALKERIDALAGALDRPRSWIVQTALEEFVATQAWQVEEIRAALAEAEAGDVASEEEVAAVFARLTTDAR